MYPAGTRRFAPPSCLRWPVKEVAPRPDRRISWITHMVSLPANGSRASVWSASQKYTLYSGLVRFRTVPCTSEGAQAHGPAAVLSFLGHALRRCHGLCSRARMADVFVLAQSVDGRVMVVLQSASPLQSAALFPAMSAFGFDLRLASF